MAEIANFVWPVGEDLTVELIYKEGSTSANAVAVDLSTGYSVRMDIVIPTTNERIYTFNSEALADVDPITTGAQADSVVEGVLSSGAGGNPNISITVPRTLTLPGGAIWTRFMATPKVVAFNYDILLRNKNTDKQVKILKGTITVEESYTLWQ
jgi:hypothetical protein